MTEPLAGGRPDPGLTQYLDVIRRRKWIVLGVWLACIGAAVAVSVLQDKQYRATTRLVVGQGTGVVAAGQSNAVRPLTATMAKLVKTNVVADNVIANLRLPATVSPEDLLARISVSIDPETAVLDISVVWSEKERATQIVQEIGLVFSQLVKERFGQPGTAASIQGAIAELPVTVTIFDPARADEFAVSPRPVRNVGAAIVLGLIFGLLAAFLRDHFDRGIRSREDVEQAFGVSVIGQVPFVRMRRGDQRRVSWGEAGGVAEAFRALRANLQYLAIKRPLKTILVTSASAEQGKTTVTSNLAVAIARSGASTAAIEGDLRRPRLDEGFGVEDAGPGLTNVLVGAVELESAMRRVTPPSGEAAVEGKIAMLPSGPLPPNPSELLSSFQMRDLLNQLTGQYDYVLIDSPPLLPVADALELARMVDGVILVVRRNRVSTDEARELRSLVERLEINVVGVVFTDVEVAGGYGYGYAEDEKKAKAKRQKRGGKAQAKAETALEAEGPPEPASQREDF